MMRVHAPATRLIVKLAIPLGNPDINFQGSHDNRATMYEQQMREVYNPIQRALAKQYNASVLDAWSVVQSYPIQPLPIFRSQHYLDLEHTKNTLHIHSDCLSWSCLQNKIAREPNAYSVNAAIAQKLHAMVCGEVMREC